MVNLELFPNTDTRSNKLNDVWYRGIQQRRGYIIEGWPFYVPTILKPLKSVLHIIVFFQSLDSNIMSSTRLGGTSPQIQLHITRDSLEDQTDETQESPHAKIVA